MGPIILARDVGELGLYIIVCVVFIFYKGWSMLIFRGDGGGSMM